jgi:hypothetical protein
MSSAPFEQFIKNLLDQTAAADALRDLTKRNLPIQGSTLLSAVESILLEETISAQFNPDGYESKEKKQAILSKLYLLKKSFKPIKSERRTTLKMETKEYWDNFYKKNLAPITESNFAQETLAFIQKNELSQQKLIDLVI